MTAAVIDSLISSSWVFGLQHQCYNQTIMLLKIFCNAIETSEFVCLLHLIDCCLLCLFVSILVCLFVCLLCLFLVVLLFCLLHLFSCYYISKLSNTPKGRLEGACSNSMYVCTYFMIFYSEVGMRHPRCRWDLFSLKGEDTSILAEVFPNLFGPIWFPII